jgi:hypothetical protein
MARKGFYVLLHVAEENSANQTADVGTHYSNSEQPELSRSTMTMNVLLMTAVQTHRLLQTGYYGFIHVHTN